MPTAPLTDLLDAVANKIAAAIAASFDVVSEVQIVSRRNFNPTPPSIDIYPGDPFRDIQTAAFGDRGELILTVRARVSTVDNIAGQELLLRFMDDEDDISVATALEDDQTLNGLAGSVYVEGNSGYVQYIDGGVDGAALLGCEWRVRVIRVLS